MGGKDDPQKKEGQVDFVGGGGETEKKKGRIRVPGFLVARLPPVGGAKKGDLGRT